MRRLGLFLLCVCAGQARGQSARLRVAVAISDSATGGLFSSAFASAFRALGDVDVVAPEEKPQYVLDGVVLCEPRDCSQALSYTLSLRLYTPYDPSLASFISATFVAAVPKATYQARVDSAAAFINQLLDGYERTHMTWTANWGRQRYEQAVRELVGRIDSQCLDKQRALNRLLASQDTSRFTTYRSLVDARPWIC